MTALLVVLAIAVLVAVVSLIRGSASTAGVIFAAILLAAICIKVAEL